MSSNSRGNGGSFGFAAVFLVASLLLESLLVGCVESAPGLVSDSESVDIGQQFAGDRVPFEYRLYSKGLTSCRILRVKASCACVDLKISDSRGQAVLVAKGKSVAIDVPTGSFVILRGEIRVPQKGTFNGTIQITYSAGISRETSLELAYQGRARALFKSVPEVVDLGLREPGERVPFEVSLLDVKVPLGILCVRSSSGVPKIELLGIKDAGVGSLKSRVLSLAATMPLVADNYIDAQLELVCASSPKPLVRLVGRTHGDILASPSSLVLFGLVDPADGSAKQVTLKSEAGLLDNAIVSWVSRPEGIELRPTRRSSKVLQVDILASKGMKPGRFQGKFKVTSKDNQAEIVLRLFGVVIHVPKAEDR